MSNSHEPRIVGGFSHHAAYDPEKCPMYSKDPKVQQGRCGEARCVDCCGQEDERDIVECSLCGLQRSVRCTFDEDYA